MPIPPFESKAVDRDGIAQHRHGGNDQQHPLSLGNPEYWRDLYSSCQTLTEKETLFANCGLEKVYLDETRLSTSTAGTVLQRCLTNIEKFRSRMTRSLCVYKLGLTTNPLLRFHFYTHRNYSKMTLLHCTPEIGVAQMLEAALISNHISEKECRNERFGGDGPNSVDHEGPHFVYIVGARADGGKPIS